MEFKEIQKRAIEIKEAYNRYNQKRGEPVWSAAEHLQAFMGDVGDLAKLVMAKNGFRGIEGHDEKIKHELADCLWVILVLAQQLDVDIEKEFMRTMDELENRTKSN